MSGGNLSLAVWPAGMVSAIVRSKASSTTISTSPIFTTSPGRTVVMRSRGTPHFSHTSVLDCGPMKGTVLGQFFSTAAATLMSMWSLCVCVERIASTCRMANGSITKGETRRLRCSLTQPVMRAI
jgi:hypothetical protein